MSDWQVGDLAVCIVAGPIFCPTQKVPRRRVHTGDNAPKDKVVRRVESVAPAKHCGCVVLTLTDGFRGASQRFRKVRPDKREACKEEFVTLLNRAKRPVSA